MSRRKPDHGYGNRSSCLGCFAGQCCKQSSANVSVNLRSFALRATNLASLFVLFLICSGADVLRAQETDFGVYARAVEFCRGTVKRPMALDLDKRVLCFEGDILEGLDISLVQSLEDKGLFVVRSFGGEARIARAIADLLRDRRATVIAYDYCISACASYLLVASSQTFVMKDCLVAWHLTTAPLCPFLEVSKDGGPKRLEKVPCSDSPPEYQSWGDEFRRVNRQFLAARAVAPPLDWPPESVPVRRMLKSMFEGMGTNPNVLWTWHPRYYAGSIKTKIVYEAYPKSQAEVDAMASKLGLPRVLYDP